MRSGSCLTVRPGEPSGRLDAPEDQAGTGIRPTDSRGQSIFLLSDLIGLPVIVDEVARGRIADLAVNDVDGELEVDGLFVTSARGADAFIAGSNVRIADAAVRVCAAAESEHARWASRPRFRLGNLVFGQRFLDRNEAVIRVARDARMELSAGELHVSMIDFDALPVPSSDVIAFAQAQIGSLLHRSARRSSVDIANVIIPALAVRDRRVGGTIAAADLADMLPEMTTADRIAELGRLDVFDTVTVLLRQTPALRREAMETFSLARIAKLISASTPARAVFLLSVLSLAEIECILQATARAHAERVRYLIWNKSEALLHFMSPCRLELPASTTVNEAILACRQLDHQAPGLPDILIVDAEHRLVGSVPISDLILNDSGTRLSAIMAVWPPRLQQSDRLPKASRLFRRHSVAALPVVDHRDRVVGEIGREELAFILGAFSELRSRY